MRLPTTVAFVASGPRSFATTFASCLAAELFDKEKSSGTALRCTEGTPRMLNSDRCCTDLRNRASPVVLPTSGLVEEAYPRNGLN